MENNTQKPLEAEPEQVQQQEATKTESKLVDARNFLRPNTRLSMPAYIREVWKRRHFTIVANRIRTHESIKDVVLGRVWVILEPFLNLAIYYLVFATFLSFDEGMNNFLGYLLVGLISFNLLSKPLLAFEAMEGPGKNLARTLQFPKLTLVLSYVLRIYIDFLPAFAAMVIFIITIPPHALPTPAWALAPIVYLLAVPFSIGIASIAAALAAFFPDIRLVIRLFARLWFYLSAVFWSVDMLADKPLLYDLARLNPAWTFLDMLRTIFLTGQPPVMSHWIYFTAWSIMLFGLGFVCIWRLDVRMSKALER